MIAPLGSSKDDPIGEHKGFVLSLIVELLTAILPGGQMSFQLRRGGACHFFAVIDPNVLGGRSRIQQALVELSQRLENTSTIPGYSGYRIPGYMSNRIQIDRLNKGIPLHLSTINTMAKLADELQITKLPTSL